MRIAYLLLAHRDPCWCGRLVERLTRDTEHHVFIHVDERAAISPYLQIVAPERATFVFPRDRVWRGGFSMVVATVRLLRTALKHGNFERFVLLREGDWPTVSNSEMENYFIRNRNREFMAGRRVEAYDDCRNRFCLRWHMDHSAGMRTILNLGSRFRSSVGMVPSNRAVCCRISGFASPVYLGSPQFFITEAAARYLTFFAAEQVAFNRYFYHVLQPDESYFHSILYNSPLADWVVSPAEPASFWCHGKTNGEVPDGIQYDR